MTATSRWVGRCIACNRENLEVESRREHGERMLCDRCASRPYEMPSARGIDPPRERSTARQRLVAALRDVGYVDRDRVIARCPICEGSLGVVFENDREAAFHCFDAGCDERQILQTLTRPEASA